MTVLLEAHGIRRTYMGGAAFFDGRGEPILELEVGELAVDRGRVLGMLGPSGAGKTTLLRILCLLERPDAGEVMVDGKPASVRSLRTRRRMAAALQSQVLWRGTVIDNAEFGMRMRGVGRRDRRARAEAALEEVGLAGIEGRSVSEISGGQVQRVMIARALAVEPEVLFLDEPLAHIDEPLRESLAVGLRQFTRRTGCATVWVTHDRSEALSISDEVAVIDRGKLAQWGPAMQVFARPADDRVARLVGADNILPGKVVSNIDGIAEIDVGGPVFEAMSSLPAGTEVFLLVRPEDLSVWLSIPRDSSLRNRTQGRIKDVVALGPLEKLFVDSSPPVVALITRPSYEELGLSVGSNVWLGFKAAAAHVVRRT